MNYIYLHGFCSGENSYKGSYFRKKFAETGRVLHTPDLNGGDFEHLTMTAQLKAIRELIENTKGDITMLGSSMGGYLSALIAEETPRVKKIVLIAPAFQFAMRYEKRIAPGILDKWRKDQYIEVFHHAYQENRRLHINILDDARQYDKKCLQRQIPTLIFHGIDDESVSYRLSVDYLNQNSTAQLMLLKSDHAMTNNVELMWRHIRLFLDI